MEFNNEQSANISSINTEPAQIPQPASISGNGHKFVDLGLSVKWAVCNVGAISAEQAGTRLGWGIAKNQQAPVGKWLDDIAGNADYDIAANEWGAPWRMPMEAELSELRKKCVWKRTNFRGVNGYKVTGPNGNSIFLPVTESNTEGYYWSSSSDGEEFCEADALYFDSKKPTMVRNKYEGKYCVRPVYEEGFIDPDKKSPEPKNKFMKKVLGMFADDE